MLLMHGFTGKVVILYSAYFLEIERTFGVPSVLNGCEGTLALRLSGSVEICLSPAGNLGRFCGLRRL